MTFIKWVGGKVSLLDRIVPKIISKMDKNKRIKYYEPFLGGGAVLIKLLETIDENMPIEFIASDINKELIICYRS